MPNQLRQQIEQISREKSINPDVVIAAIEDAILTASKKYYKTDEDLRSRFNESTWQIEVLAVKQVVEEMDNPPTQISLAEARKLIPEAEVGAEIEFPKPTDVLGRIAAQTAKQVLLQRVRDAERDLIFNEYKDRKGELIRGIVRRFEKGNNIIVDIGRTEGILPFREQTPPAAYHSSIVVKDELCVAKRCGRDNSLLGGDGIVLLRDSLKGFFHQAAGKK